MRDEVDSTASWIRSATDSTPQLGSKLNKDIIGKDIIASPPKVVPSFAGLANKRPATFSAKVLAIATRNRGTHGQSVWGVKRVALSKRKNGDFNNAHLRSSCVAIFINFV